MPNSLPLAPVTDWSTGNITFTSQILTLEETDAYWGESTTYPKRKVKSSMTDSEQEPFYNRPLSKIIDFRSGRQTGLIGLEIEAEGKQLVTETFKYWSCHTDNSLRETDGHPAREYVLRQPLSYEDVVKALDYLERKLVQAESSLVFSSRTSVHVHLNCQAYTVKQLYCFILLYLVFEEVFIDWASPERAGNLFCLRAKDSDFYVQMLESVLKQQSFKSWREDLRYSACNVNSIVKFGSLEFRALRGTIDSNLILTWIRLLCIIQEQAEKYDNPIEIVEDFNRLGPLPFFKKILQDDKTIGLFSNMPNLSGKLWSGLRMMRDVAYTVDPWEKFKPKKNEQERSEETEKETSGLIRDGQRFYFNGRDYYIQTSYNSTRLNNWHFRSLMNEHYQKEIPVGYTLYYITPEGWEDDWLELDIRQGPPDE